MQTDTFYLSGHAIELEAIVLRYRYGTDSGLQSLHIRYLLALISSEFELVEIRMFRRPKLWISHLELSLDGRIGTIDSLLCHNLSRFISQSYDRATILGKVTLQERIHLQLSLSLVSLECTGEGVPSREVDIAIKLHFHGAIKTATWIPAAALLHILEVNLHKILLATKLHVWGNVDAEGIVAISPLASLLAIHEDGGLTHRTIEYQDGTFVALWQGEVHAILALAYPRKRTRTTRLLRFLLLAILFDGNHLEVPFLVEWSGDSPVMRHLHLCPRLAITREIPRWQVDNLSTLRHGHRRESQGESRQCQFLLSYHYYIYK